MSQITACVPDKLVEALGASDPGDYLDGTAFPWSPPTPPRTRAIT